MDSRELPNEGDPEQSVRRLKIEEHGDFFSGRVKPKIRLMGHWLERAGFKPGKHVRSDASVQASSSCAPRVPR